MITSSKAPLRCGRALAVNRRVIWPIALGPFHMGILQRSTLQSPIQEDKCAGLDLGLVVWFEAYSSCAHRRSRSTPVTGVNGPA